MAASVQSVAATAHTATPEVVDFNRTTRMYSDGSTVRSLSARSRMRVKFVNASPVAVRIYWIDYDALERPYGAVLPSQSKIFMTHAWRFASDDPELVPDHFLNVNGKTVVFPNSQQRDYVIEAAAMRLWTCDSHRRYFSHEAGFCAVIHTLLQAHYKRRDVDARLSTHCGCACALNDSSGIAVLCQRNCYSAAAVAHLLDTTPGSEPETRFCDLPDDILYKVLAAVAPRVAVTAPLEHGDMELPPPPLQLPADNHLQLACKAMGDGYGLTHPHTREYTFWIVNKLALQAQADELQVQQNAQAAATALAAQQAAQQAQAAAQATAAAQQAALAMQQQAAAQGQAAQQHHQVVVMQQMPALAHSLWMGWVRDGSGIVLGYRHLPAFLPIFAVPPVHSPQQQEQQQQQPRARLVPSPQQNK